MILCAVVIVILLSMMLFKREGYKLSDTESKDLNGILEGSGISDYDRTNLMNYIDSMSPKSPAGRNPDDLRSFFNKNEGKPYIPKLKGFMEGLARSLTKEAEQTRGGMGGSVVRGAASAQRLPPKEMMMVNSFIPGQGGDITSRLPSSFGCNRTPGDSKFSCTFK